MLSVTVPRRTPSDHADIVVYADDPCRVPYLVVENKPRAITQREADQGRPGGAAGVQRAHDGGAIMYGAVYAIDSITAATWVTAAATTVLAVFTGVTLWFLRRQEKRAMEDRYELRRPLLCPTGLRGVADDQGNVHWTLQYPALMLRNAGAGVALNVAALLLGEHGRPLGERFTAWCPLPMPPDPTPQEVTLRVGNSSFPDTDTIASHPLSAPTGSG